MFLKSNVPVEAAQAEFTDKVGDYQQGRFWAQFDGPMDLGPKVLAALKSLTLTKAPLTFTPLSMPVTVSWRSERRAVPPSQGYSTPVLELQVLPIGPGPLTGVASLPALAQSLAGRARELGFFGQADPLSVSSDGTSAWAVRTATTEAGGAAWRGGAGDRRTDPYSGLVVDRDGTILVFQSIPTDTLGALINSDDLEMRLTVILRLVGAFLPSTEHLAVAVSLKPLDRVAEGDPAEVGRRSSGSMPHSQGLTARVVPQDQIPAAALPDSVTDLASEYAARLLTAVRDAGGTSTWR